MFTNITDNNDPYTQNPRLVDVLYHGATAEYEDAADYLPRDYSVKAVRIG